MTDLIEYVDEQINEIINTFEWQMDRWPELVHEELAELWYWYDMQELLKEN